MPIDQQLTPLERDQDGTDASISLQQETKGQYINRKHTKENNDRKLKNL